MDAPKNRLIFRQTLLSNTFYVAMRLTLKVVQYFSYFPIDLGNGNRTHQLEFRWLYWRTGYCLITFVLSFIELIFVIVHTFMMELTYQNLGYFAFQLSGLVQFILFSKLTYHWPEFVREWSKVEVSMGNYKMPTSLRQKLNGITTIFMVSALVEHSLVIAYKLKKSMDHQPNISSGIEDYFVRTYQHIFNFVGYSFWTGLVVQRTFNWAFADVFIMLIGAALTYRLKQISKRVETMSTMKVNNRTQWKVVRKDYVRITQLCQAVNSRISAIIIVCFLTNLYFVLLQLFFSMQLIDNIMQKIYFYVSFGLILIRNVGVCVFGGAVYEEWRNMGFYLNCVVTSAYNEENILLGSHCIINILRQVERMTCHVHSWELSLSGKNFFKVSRGLILKIAGAIVTYELVLLHFYRNCQ